MFSLGLLTEKMQFFRNMKTVLAEIIHPGLNKDWFSCFSLFCNKVRLIRDTMGCTLLAVITAIAVNAKIQTSRGFTQMDDNTLPLTSIPLESPHMSADSIRMHFNTESGNECIILPEILSAGMTGCCVNVDIWENPT